MRHRMPTAAGRALRATGADRVVGVVLAGGRSARMGRDKATLVVDGAPLADSAARRLAAVCDDVVIADRGRGVVPGWPSLADADAAGPAGGILGAAAARPRRSLLVLACDLPAVTVELLADLARPGPWDWALPRTAVGIEPLCALYRPAALAALERLVARGQPAPRGLAAVADLRVRYLQGRELGRFGDPTTLLRNLNEPADLSG